jgi:hypothetical protein
MLPHINILILIHRSYYNIFSAFNRDIIIVSNLLFVGIAKIIQEKTGRSPPAISLKHFTSIPFTRLFLTLR